MHREKPGSEPESVTRAPLPAQKTRHGVRLFFELVPWLCLLFLPPLIAVSAGDPQLDRTVERAFLSDHVLKGSVATPGKLSPRPGLAVAWFAFFQKPLFRRLLPAWLGRSVAVFVAWLMIAIAVSVLLALGAGLAAAAASLLLLALHPALRGLGSLQLPWLPAAAFILVAIAFLQTMALPTLAQQPRSPGRWGPRVLAILGCGLSLGLAGSAEGSTAIFIVIPGFLMLLSMAAALFAMYRIRERRPPITYLVRPWPLFWRTMPWSVGCFFIQCLLVLVASAVGRTQTESLLAQIPRVSAAEIVFAWLALPGLLLLFFEEGRSMSLRSRIGGGTVLLVSMLTFWYMGPAWNHDPGPVLRILNAAVFAASVGLFFRLPDEGTGFGSLWRRLRRAR